ncbi:extracellular calcium-sensing receptor [Xenopus laevis]|uniref:Extracellular calcium-sensing receptor n=1 Tax=Xenopus laevis TaxID=8355 RepID=A0A8J1MKP6_XENLA|nr:extracellular calcium-sensing receptor [Xenopus laevis]
MDIQPDQLLQAKEEGPPNVKHYVTVMQDMVINLRICKIVKSDKWLQIAAKVSDSNESRDLSILTVLILPRSRVSIEYYQSMQALIFAVEEINSDPELLPNITIGYKVFDTCYSLRKVAQEIFSMLSGVKGSTPNYNCHQETRLAGIIGDSGSTRSILMAQILGLYHYPQISYFATSPLLSNRNLFPSFFRTVPSDEFQMRGLAQLVSHFGWSWVGLLANDNDYGQLGLQIAMQEIINSGACVAFTENILTSQPNRNAPRIARVIKESTAKVVIAITSDSDFVIVLEELLKQNVTGKIWIASEAWATSDLLSNERFQGILLGTIGFAIYSGQMPRFSEYLKSLHPSNDLSDPFIKEFWEQAFFCKWPNQTNFTLMDNAREPTCTGTEKLDSLLTDVDRRVSFNVFTAVYAIAWALHNLFNCTTGVGPFYQGTCANISSFHPWHLLHYVKKVIFKTPDGNQVSFDERGNPPAVYDIMNWHLTSKGTLEQVTVGKYDLSAPNGKTLNIDNGGIDWASKTQVLMETVMCGLEKVPDPFSRRSFQNGITDIASWDAENFHIEYQHWCPCVVPLSKCSSSCSSGFRKVIVPGKPSCCYECARCPQGQISNQTDAVKCHPCSWDMWPNLQQDRCLPRTTEFLSYEELLGYSLAAISIFSSLIPLVILGIFIHFKNTPVVRANNYSLSYLLLLSLFLCFLCSLGFIGYPQPEKCILRQVAFGIIFALCISCVLAKTITVVIAFNATKPGSRLRKWTGVKVSYCVIMFCVFIQIIDCVFWLIFSPPFHELDINTQPGVIIVNCNEGSPTAFWCMLGYLGFLATVSFIVAFLARRLPDSFNEAKFITFSMLAFLSVWVSFIPAYLSARGMYTVAMEVFAILSSSWAVVVCIFVPKCFIILFRPNMNSRENLRVKRTA